MPPSIPDASCYKQEQSNFLGTAPDSPCGHLIHGVRRPGRTSSLPSLMFQPVKGDVDNYGTKKYPASYFGVCHWLAGIKQSVSEDCIEKDENIERPGNLGERVLIQD